MMTRKDNIASRLEDVFSKQGFAEPGVDELKASAGVSLKTLYRYFPSKVHMVIGALDFRHSRYLEFLAVGEPAQGRESILHVFERLNDWMHESAPYGCLFVNSFAAYPNNLDISSAVKQHKHEMVDLMSRRGGIPELSQEFFLLHEGVSAAWPLVGEQVIKSAKAAVIKLFDGANYG